MQNACPTGKYFQLAVGWCLYWAIIMPSSLAGQTTKPAAPVPIKPQQQVAAVQPYYDYTFAVLKYSGGDWYEGNVGVRELMKFMNKTKLLNAAPKGEVVELSSFDLFDYPLLYVTGHGGWKLSDPEAIRLREYLKQGGMLFINDDYGLDVFVQEAVRKVFPQRKWVRMPFGHAIFSIYFQFPEGAPKIHKHDGGAPEVWGIYQDGELAILYTKNTDIGDGWAPYQVHKNSVAVRRQALQFGVNVILYALTK